MAASMLKSTGDGRRKMGQAVRKSPQAYSLENPPSQDGSGGSEVSSGIQLGESTGGKEPGRQLATKAVYQKPAKTSGKEIGRKPATKATMPAAAKAADRKPTKMHRKEPGRQPATKTADRKPAKMLGKEPGRPPAMKADPKLAEKRRSEEPGREPKPSGCQKPGVKVARPTYWVMVKEAISSLKRRRGSSQQALAKYLEENYGEGLPENFGKILSRKLKEWSKADGQLTKVKNSYKLK